MKKTKEKKKVNYFILIFRIVSIIIILVCLYLLYVWYQDNEKNNSIQASLSDSFISFDKPDENGETFSPSYSDSVDENGVNIEQFRVDFNALIEQNPDSVAWVRIIDTNISYPIVQAEDNVFYLTHNIEKNKNGAGWIFADHRNNFERLDKNTIVYGHNRRNGTMFSNLQFYLDETFCADPNHHFINFCTKDTYFLGEVFSVYKISASKVELPYSFTTITELEDTLEEWKNNSVYDFQTSISPSDNFLTLYTCDDNTSYRIILHAKLIPLN